MPALNFTFLDNNIVVAIICGFFVYVRTINYYKVIPRDNILSALYVTLWTYISLTRLVYSSRVDYIKYYR